MLQTPLDPSYWQQFHSGVMSQASSIGTNMMGGAAGIDRGALGGMGMAGAVGGPLASMGMGMLGLDPMSLAMKVGSFGWGKAGLLGAGMGAGGVLAGASILGTAGAFAGNQMMQGAHQQSQLNAGLQNSFHFMNPNSSTGRGFSRQDMAGIGQTIRGMTGEFGPGGEVATFGELSKLAQNMGKMGGTQNVRTVQEFKDNFRKMVETLKVVATELGTTLEEAQKAMNGLKNAGIFKANQQMTSLRNARSTALSGNLAMSEVTDMMQIGSQISRSVGGTGRQGANAGMRTIGDVGNAMAVGALSEEDVYNATGLTGAEGRQAYAANQLSRSASFLKGGRGRRFLASIAGKNGQIDEAAAAQWMMGGMGTGETMQLAGKNLANVGRAGFIHNEGRLRGAALEKFGGLAQSMVYQQWLNGRGIDPNKMDDRSMIAFERFSGLGRDEAEGALKQLNAMPEMMARARQTASDAGYLDKLAQEKKGQGIEGAKRRFEQTREHIQGKLQQVGADMMTSASNVVERAFNTMIDHYERRATEGVLDVARAANLGGRNGAGMINDVLGGGAGKLGAKTFGVGSSSSSLSDSGLAKFREAQATRRGGVMGWASPNRDVAHAASLHSEELRNMYAGGLAGKDMGEREEAIKKLLEQKAHQGDASASRLLHQMNSETDTASRASTISSIERGMGIDASASLAARKAEGSGFLGNRGGYRTAYDANRAIGGRLLGTGGEGTLGQALGGYVGSLASGHTSTLASLGRGYLDIGHALNTKLFGEEAADSSRNRMSGWFSGGVLDKMSSFGAGVGSAVSSFIDKQTSTGAQAAAAGAFIASKEGKKVLADMMSGDPKALKRAQDMMMKIQSKGHSMSDDDKAHLGVLQRASIGAEYLKVLERDGSISDSERGRLTKMSKDLTGREMTEDEMKGGGRAVYDALLDRADQDRAEYTRYQMDQTGRRKGQLATMGLVTADSRGELSLNKEKMKEIDKAGLGSFADDALALAKQGDLLAVNGGDEETLRNMSQLESGMHDRLSNMSLEQKKQAAKLYAGTDVGSWAGESVMRENRFAKQMRGKGGLTGALAGNLGLELSEDEQRAFSGLGDKELAQALASKAGIKDDKFVGALADSVTAGRAGQAGKAADALSTGLAQSEEAQKKVKEANDANDPGAVATKNMAQAIVAAIGESQADIVTALGQVRTAIEEHPVEGSGAGPVSPAAKTPKGK